MVLIAHGVCAELRGARKGLRSAKSLLGALSALATVAVLGLSPVCASAASTTSLSANHNARAGLLVAEVASEPKSPEANPDKVEPGKQPTTPPGSSRQKRGGPNSAPATDQPATPVEGQNDLIKVIRPKLQ